MLVSINFKSEKRQSRTRGLKAYTTKKRISFIDVLNLIHFLQVCHHEFPFLGMVCKNNLGRFIHWIFIYRHSLAAINY